MGVFPVPLLHRLLRSNEQLANDFITRYNQALSAFLDSQRNMEHYLRSAMGVHTPSPSVADWAKLMWGPFNPQLWNAPAPASGETPVQPSVTPPPAAPPPAAEQPPDPDQSDLRRLVDELRQQIQDLRSQSKHDRRKRRHPSDDPAAATRRPPVPVPQPPQDNGEH
jgi:hypothetical protein